MKKELLLFGVLFFLCSMVFVSAETWSFSAPFNHSIKSYSSSGDFSNGFVIDTWIKPTSLGQGYVLFRNGNFLLQVTSTSQIQCGVYDGSTWKPLVINPAKVKVNTVYHVVCDYDNSKIRLFVDGTLVSSASYSKHLSNNFANLSIGNRQSLDRGFTGFIYNVTLIKKSVPPTGSCGDGTCSSPENLDNCPWDRGIKGGNVRNVADIYTPKDVMINQLKTLADNNPSKMSYEVIGQTINNKDIYLFKVGNPSGGVFMFDGETHGAEDCGTETGFKFVEWVVNNNSVESNNILENNYLLFIPIINLDNVTRQNMRRVYSDGTSAPFGVDLNRNFVGYWYNAVNSSPLNNYEYKGLIYASEPETQAVRFAIQKYNPSVYLNTHCGGGFYLNCINDSSTSKELQSLNVKVLDEMSAASVEFGADTFGAYDIECNRKHTLGGYVISDSYGFGASSWIIEIAGWNDLPKTLQGFNDKFYDDLLPVYLGMSRAVQKDFTFSNNYQEYADLSSCNDASCDGNWLSSDYSSQQLSYLKDGHSGANWMLKDDCGIFNVSIPSSCFNYDNKYLNLSYLRGEGFGGLHLYCQDVPGKCKDFSCSWTNEIASRPNCGDLSEEGVLWENNAPIHYFDFNLTLCDKTSGECLTRDFSTTREHTLLEWIELILGYILS